MTRKRIVLVFAGLFGLVLLGAVLFRLPLAQAALQAVLAGQGVEARGFRVTQLDLRRLVVVDIAVGPGPDLSIGQVEAGYSLGALLDGRLDSLAVTAARIRLLADGDGVTVVGLPPSPSSDTQTDGDAGPLRLPSDEIRLTGVHIDADTPAGTVAVDIDGTLKPGSDGIGVVADLGYVLSSAYGTAAGRLAAQSNETDHAQIELTVDKGSAQGPFASARDLAGHMAATVVDGRLTQASLELAAGTLSANPGETVRDTVSGTVAVSGAYGDDRVMLTVILNEAAEAAAISLDATVDTPLSAPSWNLTGRVELTAQSALWPALAVAAPSAGRATVALNSRGQAPADWRTLAAGTLPALLASFTGTAQAEIDIKGVDHVGLGQGLDAEAEIDAELDNGALTVRLPRRTRMHLAALSPQLFDPTVLPAGIRPRRLGAIDLDLHPHDDGQPTLTLRPDGDSYRIDIDSAATMAVDGALRADASVSGSLTIDDGGALRAFDLASLELDSALSGLPSADGATLAADGALQGSGQTLSGDLRLRATADRVSLPDLEAESATLRLPLRVNRDGRSVVLRLSDDGQLSVGSLSAGPAAVTDGAEIALTAARAPLLSLTLPEPADGGLSADLALSARSEALTLALQAEGGEPTLIRLAGVDTTVSASAPADKPLSADTELSVASLTLPAHAVGVRKLSARASLHDDGRRAEASVMAADLFHDADIPLVAPVALSASAARQGDGVTFVASLRDRQGQRRLTAKGGYDLAARAGHAALHLPTLTFAPNALQPNAFFPPLSNLTEVTGQLSGDLDLRMTSDGIDGGGRLQVSGLGFTLGGLQVSGIDTALRLTGLSPLASAPDQTLNIAAVDSVTSVRDIAVRYRLGAGDDGENSPRLFIDTFSANLFGGSVTGADVVADPVDGRLAGTLTVQSLSLEQIMALIGAEGVTGSGALSGSIPLSIDGSTLVVTGGTLAANDKGVLRIPSDQVAQAVGTGNKDLDMVARVLEDFRYETLSMQIDKQAEGDGQVRLSMLGHNPAVLDGHPVQFNINLTSNVDELLTALVQAYGQATGLMNRALENLR